MDEAPKKYEMGVGNQRALASKIAQRLLREGKAVTVPKDHAHVSGGSCDCQMVEYKLTQTIAEEVSAFFD